MSAILKNVYHIPKDSDVESFQKCFHFLPLKISRMASFNQMAPHRMNSLKTKITIKSIFYELNKTTLLCNNHFQTVMALLSTC